MKTIVSVVLVLLTTASPAFAQSTYASCKADAHRVYQCAVGTNVPVPVSKRFWKANCYTYSDGSAVCRVPPIAAQPGEKVAKGPGLLHKIRMDTLYIAGGALLIIIIANGGGGAFQ